MIPPHSLYKLAQPPEWVAQWFEEIDSKSFGPTFDRCFEEDAEMIFGIDRIHGLAKIKAHLEKFDSTMDTKHTVIDCWSAGNVLFLRGEVAMTPHTTQKTVKPAFVHVWHLSDKNPQKIQHLHGAVGPTS